MVNRKRQIEQRKECQLDELWSFVNTKKQHLASAKLICESYGDAWVWIAFAPAWRLVLAFALGKWLRRVDIRTA